MIFRKNKPAPEPENDSPTMRSRESEPGKRGANALARRFLVDEEPDTIDLSGPGEFHGSVEETEPETRDSAAAPAESAMEERLNVLSQDPDTGKFYVHPGSPGTSVLLGGERVTAVTELRKGDRIRIGEAEFEFLL